MNKLLCGFAVCAALLMIGSCARPLPSYRYKMTVDVMTPIGVRSGSSVIEITNWDLGKGFAEASGMRSYVNGEAVTIDLGQGKTAFALLNSRTDHDFAHNIMRDIADVPASPELVTKWLRSNATKSLQAKIPQDKWPVVLTFDDVRNPRSVKAFDSSGIRNATNGEYRVVRVHVGMTDEPVTRRMEDILPWSDDYEKLRELSYAAPRDLKSLLNETSFSR